MPTFPSLEEQIAYAGIRYGRWHDIAYRTGMMMQMLGIGALAVLYPLESPFFTAGIMLFELGALLSTVFVLIWITWIRKIILGFVVLGIGLQIAGFRAPEEYAGTMILLGLGLVAAGAAAIAGKEAYRFGWREGWWAVWLYAILVPANLFFRASMVLNSLGFSALFLMLLFLTGRKLRQPLLAASSANAGEPSPEKK